MIHTLTTLSDKHIGLHKPDAQTEFVLLATCGQLTTILNFNFPCPLLNATSVVMEDRNIHLWKLHLLKGETPIRFAPLP